MSIYELLKEKAPVPEFSLSESVAYVDALRVLVPQLTVRLQNETKRFIRNYSSRIYKAQSKQEPIDFSEGIIWGA